MSHPFHDYVASRLDELLRTRRVVVWYDPRREFEPFVDELEPLDPAEGRGGVPRVWVRDLQTHLARYDGSFFALRARVEPIVELDLPEHLLVYVPGEERDPHGSVLMELELGGTRYQPTLKRLARNELRKRYTDGEIDEMLRPETVRYADVARYLSIEPGAQASLLKLVLGEGSSEHLLTKWLAEPETDAGIEDKQARAELFGLIRSRLGLELAPDASLAQARHRLFRYVLVNEFRGDLDGTPPKALDVVPSIPGKEEHGRVRQIADTLRKRDDCEDAYREAADRVEAELKLAELGVQAERLGSIDTFRFEEGLLLEHAAELVCQQQYDRALELVEGRRQSFWVDREIDRQAQWEACARAAALGAEVTRCAPEVKRLAKKASAGPDEWVRAYAAEDGWHRADRAQRALEAWVANMNEDPEPTLEKGVALVRRAHEELLEAMAKGYSAALVEAKWSVPEVLHQTRIYPELVERAGGRTAYFFVDAMRYEMGTELAQLLEDAEELRLVPATAALPSITHVGMAALLPGASSSFSVVEHKGRLASKIDDTIMPGLDHRQRLVKARRPDAVDLGIGAVLTKSTRQLDKAVGDAPLVIVRSQSIDKTGETDGGYMARQIMDAVLGNVARAVRKLAKVGVEHFVITSDHGHQFTTRREDDMLMDRPVGETVEQHRRSWAGRGGQTSGASVRVSGAELGYDTDLDFIFPTGLAVFKAGGDLAFHHGGISLQEMVVPVVTFRMPVEAPTGGDPTQVYLHDTPAQITNRMFTARITATQLLGDDAVPVRLVLIDDSGKVAGGAGMASGAESFDAGTKVARLTPSKPAQIGLMLANADAKTVRIVAQDPHTDAILTQTEDLPVKLGLAR
jgi:hypothetical protein